MSEIESLLKESEKVFPMNLSWKNLSCSISNGKEKNEILKSISGQSFHSEMLVIMGASGAGKTTLLNILSNRIENSSKITIAGEVTANTQLISSIPYNNYIGYVTQENYLIESLTVYETLLFVANLRTNYEDKSEKVLEMIDQLQLTGCRDTLVGGFFLKAISGGEKKRLSIGMELITNPSILFLDEPTSGLDSFTALAVCNLLKVQAKSGKNIIASVHQPSSDIFYLFDKLMFMCNGHIVYHGTPAHSVKFFTEIGYVCPELSNPADFFIEVLHIKNKNELTDEELNTVQKVSEHYEKKHKSQPENLKTIDFSTVQFKQSFFTQLYILSKRVFLRYSRNPLLIYSRLFVIFTFAIGLDIFYWNLGTSGIRDINDRTGFLFFVVASMILGNVIPGVLGFPLIRPVITYEYHSNMYGVSALFFSFLLNDLVFDLIYSSLFSSTVYWAVDLNTVESHTVFEFFCICYLLAIAGNSLGLLCACIAGTPEIAIGSTSLFIFPFIFFSGFFRAGNFPASVDFFKYTSPYFYGFHALLKNQFDDLELTNCCIGENCDFCDPIERYNVDLSLYASIGLLIALISIFRLLSFFGMYYTVNRKEY